MVPEGKTPVAEHMGGQTPVDTDDGGRIQFGPQPNTTPETHVALDSGRPPLPNEGGEPTPPVTLVHLEVDCWKRYDVLPLLKNTVLL